MTRSATLKSALAALSMALGGCATVQVLPQGQLPTALIVKTPATVGVVVTPETGSYTHKESRASIDYEAQLGPSHKQLVEEIFKAEFADARMFDSVDAARASPGLHAIFEPRIEQFSFASAKETGGTYCAVTIRYQIGIFAPGGQPVDTLTLTGYGSGPAPKIGNGAEELAIAAYAAMRDAAAKFLTQFQGLDVAKPLLASQALQPREGPAPGSPEANALASMAAIEMVPINDPPEVVATSPSTSPGPAGPAPEIPPASPDPAAPESEPAPDPSRLAASHPAT